MTYIFVSLIVIIHNYDNIHIKLIGEGEQLLIEKAEAITTSSSCIHTNAFDK
jgi:hypothetical protein